LDPQQQTMIGEFDIEIEPIMAPTPLLLSLDLDENGILIARVRDEYSGEERSCRINYTDSAPMDSAELQRRRAQPRRGLEGSSPRRPVGRRHIQLKLVRSRRGPWTRTCSCASTAPEL